MFNKNFQEFIKLLIAKEIKFLIVGGYAVGVHGFPRYTGDLDIFIAVSSSNAKKIKSAFDEFGMGALNLTEGDFQKKDFVIEIGREPNKIQILTGIDGVDFEHAYASKMEANFEAMNVPFIGFEDLLRNKKTSARAKGLIDVLELKKIKERA